MKVASVIFSYKDPVRVMRCYGELLRAKQKSVRHTIIILDNSPSSMCPQTPDTVWLGDKNVGHGGMIDYAVQMEHYDFVGMLNCDTWGYSPDFLQQMCSGYLALHPGIVSPAIVAGSCWPCMAPQAMDPHLPPLRRSNFIETIAPYYSAALLKLMRKLSPFEQYGYVDRALSVFALRNGFKNFIVNNARIYHDAGAGMTPPARADLQTNWQRSLQAWLERFPDLRDTYDMWPDEINALGA